MHPVCAAARHDTACLAARSLHHVSLAHILFLYSSPHNLTRRSALRVLLLLLFTSNVSPPTSHSSRLFSPLQLKQLLLPVQSSPVAAKFTILVHDSMAGNHNRDAVQSVCMSSVSY